MPSPVHSEPAALQLLSLSASVGVTGRCWQETWLLSFYLSSSHLVAEAECLCVLSKAVAEEHCVAGWHVHGGDVLCSG